MQKKELSINEQIRALEEQNRKGLALAQRMSEEEQKQIRSTRELEEKKFEEFKEIIKGQRYFRIDHIDKLGIKYDILIHLSSKNSGKTTHIYKCIDKCIKRGEKFIYGRVMESEMRSEIIKFQEDKNSSVMIVEERNRYYFYRKEDIDDYVKRAQARGREGLLTPRLLKKYGHDYVGLGIIFMTSNMLGGGKYENFTTMFFDEIVSYSPKKYINDDVMYNWACAVSTILRNKKQLHIIMMGNLKPGYIPILDYYNIDSSDDLRIIRRVIKEGSKPCTILYVNSGALYTNTLSNQGAVAHHGRLEDRIFQANNKLLNSSTKVITRRIFERMQYLFAFAAMTIDGPIYYHVRHSGEDPDLFCLSVDQLTLTTYIDGPIYAGMDSIIKANFSIVHNVLDIGPMIERVYDLIEADILYFDSVKSMILGLNPIKKLAKQYATTNR